MVKEGRPQSGDAEAGEERDNLRMYPHVSNSTFLRILLAIQIEWRGADRRRPLPLPRFLVALTRHQVKRLTTTGLLLAAVPLHLHRRISVQLLLHATATSPTEEGEGTKERIKRGGERGEVGRGLRRRDKAQALPPIRIRRRKSGEANIADEAVKNIEIFLLILKEEALIKTLHKIPQKRMIARAQL